jgi:hypothetical protein
MDDVQSKRALLSMPLLFGTTHTPEILRRAAIARARSRKISVTLANAAQHLPVSRLHASGFYPGDV